MSREPDHGSLGGCLMSGAASLVVLNVPIVLCNFRGTSNHDINTNAGLARLFLTGIGLTAAFTLPFVRRFGIAPAFGALGGFACGAAYWFLNLQQNIAKAVAETGQPTEYLDSTMIIVPFAWLTIGAILSLAPLYKNKRVNRSDS